MKTMNVEARPLWPGPGRNPKPPRKDPRARFHPGQVIAWGGDRYLVTGQQGKPVLKQKRLAWLIGETLHA